MRTAVLSQLCSVSPPSWLSVREEAIRLLKLPGLVLTLTVNHSNMVNSVVSLLMSLLCAADNSRREWMSQYVRVSCRRMKNLKPTEVCFELVQKHLDTQILSLLDSSVQSVDRQWPIAVTETESGHSGSEPLQPAGKVVAVVTEQEETTELGCGTSSDVLQEEPLGVTIETDREQHGSVSLEDAATVLMDSQKKSSLTSRNADVVQEKHRGSSSSDNVEDLSDCRDGSKCGSLSDTALAKANALLHLHCVLLGSGAYTLNRVSSQLLVELMTLCPPVSYFGVRYVELSVSLLMACPHLVRCVVFIILSRPLTSK